MRFRLTYASVLLMIACLGLFCFSPIAAAATDSAGTITLDIISVNDFHGALAEAGKNPGIAKLATLIKAEMAKNQSGTIIVSAGDMFQGNPDSNMLYGQPVVAAMNKIGFSAMTTGNHEFDWGQDVLKKLIRQAGFPVIAANILDKTTGKPVALVKPYIIIERNGLKIALIGLATPETVFKTNPKHIANCTFSDPVQTVRQLVPVLKHKGADVIIVLSHLGSSVDSTTAQITGEAAELALGITGVNAIISGHSHLQVAGSVNSIPIVQAGYNGRAIGKITLTVAKKDKRVINAKAAVIAVDSDRLAAEPEIAAIVNKVQSQVAPVKDIVLGRSVNELSHDRKTFSLLGQWVTDIMRRTANADIAFQNGGGIRTGIPPGSVTMGKLYEVLPFDNTLVTLDLTGEQILRVLEYGIYNQQIGMLQYSGLTVKFDASLPAGHKITDVTLSTGERLNLAKLYRVVTNDFMVQGGDGFTVFSQGVHITDTGIPLRDCLIDAIKATENIYVTPDNRFSESNGLGAPEKPAA
ncbi:bifunctional UDP-sugar hydrolase/5'-nucleotidase [Sporomusa aerivorans]|uniref:bifunctional metallophosphatase/5'-nucleotidase n=1 Tax=Sporomusa aerivorans TaxID=204936 RepID=UPI00352AD2FF